MESKINPWVRANLEQHNEETRILMPDDRQEAYDACLAELEAACINLMEAQARHLAALAMRQELFNGLAYEGK